MYFTYTVYATTAASSLAKLLVTEMLKKYPVQCEDLFLTQPLTALQIYDLFSPIYSPRGSNAWEKELQVMVYWMNFLEDCEGTLYIMHIDVHACMCSLKHMTVRTACTTNF